MDKDRPQAPPFLARHSYRQRRLRDAMKMLPVAAGILWLLPLAARVPNTSGTGIFIFTVWLGLILVSAVLASRLRSEPDQAEDLDGN